METGSSQTYLFPVKKINMKKILSLLFLLNTLSVLAQNVGISNDNSAPDNSAMLDIKSNSKGLLIPRMTTLQRTGIVSPAIGLTVFDTDTYGNWIYRGDVNGGWQELLTTLNKHWDINGSHVYNNNVGNVGIGTNSPPEKLSINGTNPKIQLLHESAVKGFIGVLGDDFRIGTNITDGKLIFHTKGADRVVITRSGLVGIGTMNPVEDLTMDGLNPTFQLQSAGVSTGFIKSASGNHLVIGTNNTNTSGNLLLQTKAVSRVTIDETGRVGIGTTTPTSVLTVNGTNPILQIRNDDVDKGFIQLSGDDIKIGTNISNVGGRFFIRTNGADRMVLDNNGKVGIGTTSPFYPLVINATNPAISLNIAEARYGFIGVDPTTKDLVIEKSSLGSGKLMINANGGTVWGIHLTENGYFHYGSGLTPAGYPFSSQGKILAPEFVALAVGSWPDYVFDQKYQLKPLSEVKQYIDQNKHLPGIPAAAVLEKEGVPLADMTKRMMEKIEELTLYILQQQEQIDELKKQVALKKD